MAYGYSRGSRGFEPDPRDVIEDAARDAGMSVQQWLDRAVGDDADDYGRRGNRARRRGGRDRFEGSPLEAATRRIERRGQRDYGFDADQEPYPEERVDRILHTAMDTIRANEERTASALETLERRIDGRSGRVTGLPLENRVRGLIENIERGMGQRNGSAPERHAQARPDQARPDPDLIEALEQKISNVVDMIEKRGHHATPPSAQQHGQRRDLRTRDRSADDKGSRSAGSPELARIERQLAALAQRFDAIALQADENGTGSRSVLAGQLGRLHEEMSRLSRMAASPEVLSALRVLDHKLAQLEHSPIAGAQFERLMTEMASIRAGLHQQRAGNSPDYSVFERHFETIENRLEAITDKVMTLRVSGGLDLRNQKSVENHIEELKALVRTSAVPAQDNRVLGAVQSLEQRLAAIERAPQELAARFDRFQTLEDKLDAIQQVPSDIVRRLDQLQSLMAERPAPTTATTDNLEALFGVLAARVESLQHGAGDDQAFERLHQDIQAMSRKLEGLPMAQQNQGFTDVSGLERSISDLFQQLDGIKSDIGTTAEHAMRRAANDILSNAPQMPAAHLGESVQVQRALSDIHVAQQEAERRTTETLGAVHDTLQKVVGRLVDMERDMKQREQLPAAPVTHRALPALDGVPVPTPVRPSLPLQQTLQAPSQESSAHAPHAAIASMPMTILSEPPFETARAPSSQSAPIPPAFPAVTAGSGPGPMPLKPLMAHPLPPLGAAEPHGVQPEQFRQEPVREEPFRQEPARQEIARQDVGRREPVTQAATIHDTIANMRAQRIATTPAPPAVEPVTKSAFASAIAAAKGAVAGIKLGKNKEGNDRGNSGRSDAAFPPADAPFDIAGTPPPLPSANTLHDSLDLPLEPGSGRPVPGMATSPEQIVQHDPKANFLAAARRAAQTAADQSADALNSAATTVAGKGKTLAEQGHMLAATGKTTLTKKHALLLGLAALIVAVGATVQFTRDPIPFDQPKVEAPAKKTTVLERAVDRLAQATTSPAEVATATVQPRQILPSIAQDPLPPQLSAAKPDDRVMSQPVRQAQPHGAFLPSDPATVGALGPATTRAPAATTTSERPTITATNDPLLRFEGLREAERLKQAARTGDPAAFIELGTRYLEGKGAPRDPKTAALWFERASDFGSAPAQYRLGAMYREGRGVERNTKMALKYFQIASDAGNARAMHNTAVLLAEGVNGSPEYGAAGEWFKRAAEFGIRDSQYNLAILYARGLGVSQDLMASYAWFAAAAVNGDEDAGKKRDEVGARLSGEKLQQAKAAAAAWKPKTPDPAANEVAVPAGGWDAAVSAPTGAKAKPARG